MKTEYIYINKPNYISIHKYFSSNYTAFQWYYGNLPIYDKACIGVWHIKYKKLDCNFS